MKELVEVIAKSLVEHPDEVVVTENEKDDAVIIELKVGPSDMGKVIGRQGRIAKAIRTVVKAASSKSSKKVIVDILHDLLLLTFAFVLLRCHCSTVLFFSQYFPKTSRIFY